MHLNKAGSDVDHKGKWSEDDLGVHDATGIQKWMLVPIGLQAFIGSVTSAQSPNNCHLLDNCGFLHTQIQSMM